MSKKIDADKLIEDLERRKETIVEDSEHFNSVIGDQMRVGAIMAINDAIIIVKKMANIK